MAYEDYCTARIARDGVNYFCELLKVEHPEVHLDVMRRYQWPADRSE